MEDRSDSGGTGWRTAAAQGQHRRCADRSRFMVSNDDAYTLAVAIGSAFGKQPKCAACKTFGREPGLVGTIGNEVGAPPSRTDGRASSKGEGI